MKIYYETIPGSPLELVESKTIADLECHEIKLGLLPAGPLPGGDIRKLKLVVIADSVPADASLTFDTCFELVHEAVPPPYAWADTEKSPNYLNTPGGCGCTPGFWQGGFGKKLWNKTNDRDWTTAGGEHTNPFIHTTLFDNYFTPYHPGNPGPGTDELTMLDLVGTGGGSENWRKAARSVVAAYLNASFGMGYPLDADEVSAAWAAAVDDGSDKAFMDLHEMLNEYNNLGGPF